MLWTADFHIWKIIIKSSFLLKKNQMFLRNSTKVLGKFPIPISLLSPFNAIKLAPILTPAFHSLNKTLINPVSLTNDQRFGFRFIGIPQRKGMRVSKFRTKKNSPKKRGKINVKYLHRVSNHNGLLKRIKIVRNKRKFSLCLINY